MTELAHSIDTSVLQTYLSNHLTGAHGGRNRIKSMAERYADTELGPDLKHVAQQISDEYDELQRIVHVLGLHRPLPQVALAKVGELVGRLKPNGRGPLQPSPTTPLIEVELMRSAVNGKQGLWQALADNAERLGLAEEKLDERTTHAEEQDAVLERLHRHVRQTAFDRSA